jgi:parallel beta-helix repeat protein
MKRLVHNLLGAGLLGSAMLGQGVNVQDPVSIASASFPRLIAVTNVTCNSYPKTVTFSLYNADGDVSSAWQEVQTVTDKGKTVLMGASTNGLPDQLFSSETARWMGIRCEGEPETRQLLTPVAYAMKSADAANLGGRPASDYLLASTVTSKDSIGSLSAQISQVQSLTSNVALDVAAEKSTRENESKALWAIINALQSQVAELKASLKTTPSAAGAQRLQVPVAKNATVPSSPAVPAASTGSSLPESALVNTMIEARQVAALQTFDARSFGATCDGVTDDAAAIQAAITAASVSGGMVSLPGICGVGAAGLNIKSDNVVLQGTGKHGGLRILAPGSAFSTFGPTTVQFSGCRNCRADNMYIDGNGVVSNAIGLKETKSSGVTNTRIVRAGYLGAVVAVNNVGNAYSHNSITQGVGSARGLWIGNAMADQLESNASISDNQVSQMGATGIVCTCVDSQVNNNLSTHNGGSGIIFPAAGTYRASKVSATGNTVSFNQFSGFQSDAASTQTYSEFITLKNNVIEGNATSGIYVVRARDWEVSGNQIRNNLDYGVEVGEAKRINLVQNLVEDTRAGADRTQNVGIHVSAQATGVNDVEQVQVVGNTAKNNLTNGIFVVNCSPNTMTGVTVQGNLATENGSYGVRASSAQAGEITNVSIVDNILPTNASGALRVDLINAQMSGNQQ